MDIQGEKRPKASTDDLQLAYDSQEDVDLDAILEGWQPGRTPQERQARHESGRAVLEWIREQPEAVRASHVKEALYDDHALEEQSEATWWEQTARPTLNHAADQGYVDNSGRTYEWAGDE
ncbi:hypothetical protein [Natronorubrum sp. FCH18a]|uniref:hypothetical protein n=1 Tax=Natronorubrum sp. FCH18a TaxID=3447018 RepID=UPI003F5115E2